MTVVPIVEGDSEVISVPLLLRRFHDEDPTRPWVDIAHPIRVRRAQFLNKEDEFQRSLFLAREKAGADGIVLLLLDADDDCPAELGRSIRERVKQVLGDFPVSVVLANREYEAWFLASAQSLDGVRGFRWTAGEQVDAERPRDAKGWISARMVEKSYREVLDQPALTARMDLSLLRQNSRSFRKLWSDWQAFVLEAN